MGKKDNTLGDKLLKISRKSSETPSKRVLREVLKQAAKKQRKV